jgi:hypothetical protein
MGNYAWVGLGMGSIRFDPAEPSSHNEGNISGLGLDRKVEGDKVTYSYFLKEYRDGEENKTNKALQSSSSCIGTTVYGNNVYKDGNLVGSLSK